MSRHADILAIYGGSDGKATSALYDELGRLGAIGEVAINLFRACKASERAKVYRGGERGRGSFKRMAYDRKGWAIDNLARVLGEHGERLGIAWGWGEDRETIGYSAVLYIDTPAGQVSFHTSHRGSGPDYPRGWAGEAAGRVCKWVAQLLEHGA